jgi:cytochrome P450
MLDAEAAPALEAFDLRRLPADFYENPYPIYHALRARDPILLLPDGTYFVTGHPECVAIYRNPRLFSSDKHFEFHPKFGDSPLYRHHTTSLVFNDPPRHTKVRRLLAGALTQRVINETEVEVEALVSRLLDRMEEKGRVCLIADFAALIPVEVIGNLLAVPHEARGPLRAWSLAILGALEPAPSPAMLEEGNRAVAEFIDFLLVLIAERRRRPGDPDRDILTRFILGEGGEKLDEDELHHNCIFLLNAGHETTTNLIGNALYLLDRHPAVRAELLARPELMPSAIEEFLRFESPVQFGNRRALGAVEIGGKTLPEGALITLCIGAANRDPRVFSEPDRLDVTRHPNRHLAFGFGIHQCAGLNVARMEGRVALSRFLARFPRYRLREGKVWGGRARFRGFLALPAELAP